MNDARIQDWVYFRLYAGQASDRMEWFLTDVTPRVIDAGAGSWDRWFFLRYFDETGFHLRLRLRAHAGGAEALRRAIHPLCEEGLLGLAALPPSTYSPLVPHPGGVPAPRPGHVGVVPDTYEPEYDKFGGPAGVAIAEEAFQASSEIAIGILTDERERHHPRKTLLPSLMVAAIDAFAPGADQIELWRGYAEFWLRELGGTSPWRERFLAKARQLAADGVPVVTPDESLPESSRAHLVRWREALARSARAYRALSHGRAVPLVASQFVHLMNNRLGCHALDEAYLATLLEEWARGEVS